AFLLAICCLCAVPVRLLSPESRGSPTSSAVVPTSAGTQPTPTALFNFDATIFPSPVAPSPLPTTPAPATGTLTSAPATSTQTAAPPATNTSPPPTASNTGSVQVIAVNKPEEYVDLQNSGDGPVDLNGWKLISETGDQSCLLKGVLQPDEVLRVWARVGTNGFSCGYLINIWNDNISDPAALYDPQGKEVSRFPS
ncbi:MAG: lamin tail domain-containing protein, partial [Chloroflexota bacterium]|nr:lamin tail domain-containing protein [Anaerolineales bacterium]